MRENRSEKLQECEEREREGEQVSRERSCEQCLLGRLAEAGCSPATHQVVLEMMRSLTATSALFTPYRPNDEEVYDGDAIVCVLLNLCLVASPCASCCAP